VVIFPIFFRPSGAEIRESLPDESLSSGQHGFCAVAEAIRAAVSMTRRIDQHTCEASSA